MPLKLNIEKIWCRQKRKTTEQFVQISVLADMKSTKEGNSQQKPQNQPIRGQTTSGIQLQTFPSLCNTRKLRFKTWNTAEKKLFPILEAITLFNTIK